MIDDLVKDMEDAVEKLVSILPEKEIYDSLQVELKELSLYTDGTIKNNLENIKRIGRIKKKLDDIILTDDYLKGVSEFITAYTTAEKTMNIYFSELNKEYSPKTVLAEVKKQAIDDTVEALTESGISANVTTPIQNIIDVNVKSGGSYTTLSNQLRDLILSTPEADGNLVKYTKTYATDSINTYSGTYMKLVTDDLGLKWFKYTGSLIKTSRPFCKALIHKKYIHVSEFSEILKGNIDGVKVSLSGVKKNTTPDNFQQLRGGWRCAHQLIPVSSIVIPDEVKEKLKTSAQ